MKVVDYSQEDNKLIPHYKAKNCHDYVVARYIRRVCLSLLKANLG